MDHLAILEARVARARRIARPILHSAIDLVQAAAASGSALTLNPVQAQALWHHLDGHAACLEVRALAARSAGPAEPENLVAFPAHTSTPTAG